MKNNYSITFFLCLMLIFSFSAYAQLNTPRASQQAKVSQRVGITDITITYSRPSVSDREVWGKLVPYGMNNLGFGTANESPWRAGADENTVIEFSDDVKIEGKSLEAGKYGFHIIVNEDETATLIFSNNSSSWGSYFYKPEEDALRVDIKTKEIPNTNLLTYSFNDVDANSTIGSLNWEKKQFPFKVDVDVPSIVLANIRKDFNGQAGFQRQNWEQAANYALNNGGDLEEALVWIDAAIADQFFSQKTFNNLQIKSNILSKLGRNDEATAIMDEALTYATVFEIHQYGRTLIAQGEKDKALEVFKINAKTNKDTWPVNYGLARGYSANGNYKTALKHLKLALNKAPDEANRGFIKSNILKLENNEDIN